VLAAWGLSRASWTCCQLLRCFAPLLLLLLQVLRVFHDRLISDEDKDVFRSKVAELVQAR
jgi:hypothetical protein